MSAILTHIEKTRLSPACHNLVTTLQACYNLVPTWHMGCDGMYTSWTQPCDQIVGCTCMATTSVQPCGQNVIFPTTLSINSSFQGTCILDHLLDYNFSIVYVTNLPLSVYIKSVVQCHCIILKKEWPSEFSIIGATLQAYQHALTCSLQVSNQRNFVYTCSRTQNWNEHCQAMYACTVSHVQAWNTHSTCMHCADT